MKKTNRIVLAILIAAFVLTSAACSWKNAPSDVETFYSVTKEYGCAVTDMDIDDPDVRNSVKEAAFTEKEEALLCQFLIFDSKDSAKDIFAGTLENLKEQLSGSTTKVEKTLTNYSYARLADDDFVYYLARIDDTILFVLADPSYADQADAIVKALGYK